MGTQNKPSQFLKIFQNMLKLMYKSKSVALMPDITDDDEPAENRSPFLTPRSKVSTPLSCLYFFVQTCLKHGRLEMEGSLVQDLPEALGCIP